MSGILGGFKGFPGIAVNRLHAERFEDIIQRRGWTAIQWDRAVKCACYNENTGNPDPNDPTCGGIGWTYLEDLDVRISNEQLCVEVTNQVDFILKASLNGSPDSTETVTKVTRVFNITQNFSYTIGAIAGTQVTISGAPLPVPGDKVVADYIYQREAGATVKVILTNVDYQKDFIPAGEWLNGDAIMTASGQYDIGLRDRITIPENVVRTSEQSRRNELDVKGRSLERLRYKSGVEIFKVRDLTQFFVEGTDFTLGPDSTIVWAGGARPKHKVLRLKYTGDATTATVTVTGTELTTTLVGQTDGSLDLSVSFSSYPTLRDVVDFIESQDGYEVEVHSQSELTGLDAEEKMSFSIALAGIDIKGVDAFVENEDLTQYTVEYSHYLAFAVYTRKGMDRRHDDGAVLPGKYWLRLWEHTDRFSNDAS